MHDRLTPIRLVTMLTVQWELPTEDNNATLHIIRWKRLQQANCLDQRCNVGRSKMLPKAGWTFQSWNWDHSNHGFWLQLRGGQEHVAWNEWNEWTRSYMEIILIYFILFWFIILPTVPCCSALVFPTLPTVQWPPGPLQAWAGHSNASCSLTLWVGWWERRDISSRQHVLGRVSDGYVSTAKSDDPRPPWPNFGWVETTNRMRMVPEQPTICQRTWPCARRSWMRAPAKLSSSGNMWWTWEDEPLQHTLAISRYMYLYICSASCKFASVMNWQIYSQVGPAAKCFEICKVDSSLQRLQLF